MAARSQLRFAALLWILSAASAGAAPDPTAAMFDPARVLEIDIQMEPDAWDRLRVQERTLVSLFRGQCFSQPFANPYTWFPARVSIDGQSRDNVGIRKKGFLGSLDTIKPALKINLDEFQENATIYDVKKLTLNNAKQDPSLVRQCLGYQLFNQAGVPAPRCNFAHVTVNSRDLGIYVNVEEIRKPMLARHFSDKSGNLYEGTVSDFHPALVDTFEAQTNEETNDRSDLDAVIAALGTSDADLPTALGNVVDLDAFATYWAMEGLVGLWDGYSSNRNNFYTYHDPKSGKFHFIPWGIDGILGEGSPIAALNPAANSSVFAYSAITRRLVDLPDTWTSYVARMNALLGSVWDETAIFAEIDRMEALLAPWAGDLSAAIAPVREFVAGRRARVAQDLAGGPTTFPPLTFLDYCLAPNGSLTGGFVASWGSTGTLPPFQTGAAVLRGEIADVDLEVVASGAEAGLDPNDPNVHRGFITLYFELDTGAFAVAEATVDSTLLVPGARLAIDGQQVNAHLAVLDGVTPGAYLDQGILKIRYASTRPGGKVCGAFRANSYFFPLLPLGDAASNGEPSDSDFASHALGLVKRRPQKPVGNPGELMRQCQPGRER